MSNLSPDYEPRTGCITRDFGESATVQAGRYARRHTPVSEDVLEEIARLEERLGIQHIGEPPDGGPAERRRWWRDQRQSLDIK